MRVLVTGYNRQQAGMMYNGIGRGNLIYGLVDAMRDLGHDVDWRAVDVGEPLGDYDLVWVTLLGSQSFNATHAPGGLWAGWQAHYHDLPLVYYFDDWNIKQVLSHHRSTAKLGWKQLGKRIGGTYFYKADDAEVERHQEQLIAQAGYVGRGRWDKTVAVFATHGWGDHSRLSSMRQGGAEIIHAVTVDPGAFVVPCTEYPIPSDKLRQHVSVSLSPQNEWYERLGLGWPVGVYGPRKLGAPRLAGEHEVLEAYARYHTVLQAPYYHKGSGWYRSRYQWTAAAGSICVNDPVDAAAIGGPYELSSTDHVRELEAWTDSRLQTLAKEQREWWRVNYATGLDELRSQVEDTLRTARIVTQQRSSRSR